MLNIVLGRGTSRIFFVTDGRRLGIGFQVHRPAMEPGAPDGLWADDCRPDAAIWFEGSPRGHVQLLDMMRYRDMLRTPGGAALLSEQPVAKLNPWDATEDATLALGELLASSTELLQALADDPATLGSDVTAAMAGLASITSAIEAVRAPGDTLGVVGMNEVIEAIRAATPTADARTPGPVPQGTP